MFNHLFVKFYLSIFLLQESAEALESKSLVEKNYVSEKGKDFLNVQDWWGGDLSKKGTFKCPSSEGIFSDIKDCNRYYVCNGGLESHRTCSNNKRFDHFRKTCVSFWTVVCAKGKGDMVFCSKFKGNIPDPKDCSKYFSCLFFAPKQKACPEGELFDGIQNECKPANEVHCGSRKKPMDDIEIFSTTPDGRSTTKKHYKFFCPSFRGRFPDPEDCSKYYSCSFFIPKLKECTEDELFDGIQNECKQAIDVNCGSRKRPTGKTSAPTTPLFSSTSPDTTTPEPSEPESATPEPKTVVSTTFEPTTTELTTPEPTTAEPTTTERTGPPDNDCDEDDVDCIITETGGQNPKWFKCSERVGFFAHPSSAKLFIFCKNFKPFVKRCGQDSVYSNDLKTCVSS